MPEHPVTESAEAESAKQSAPDKQQDVSSHRGSRTSSQWPTYLALALSAVAVALAALAYFHPADRGAPGPPQQSGDARANVCTAAAIARKGVVINTHLQQPDNNPIGELAVVANARLSLVGGGNYLYQRLAANNAAPTDVTTAVNTLANTMQQLGASYMAGVAAQTLDPLRRELDAAIDQVSKACP